MQSIDYEEVLKERMIVGTPGRVIDRLKQLEEELGLDGILAELNPGSLVPHARVMEALRLLCEEVMPKFK
jgi:alkanesulfonate monooxygenase SsuD/methylene tetrahydromethanopterin reductase-like flavin-dependent oxidoreductase (luciferase family)